MSPPVEPTVAASPAVIVGSRSEAERLTRLALENRSLRTRAAS